MRWFLWCAAAVALVVTLGIAEEFTVSQQDASFRIRRRDCSSDANCEHGTCNAAGQCSCSAGYAGRRCDVECNGGASNPCSGHGTCLPQLRGRCRCQTGFTGADCSFELPKPTSPNVTESNTSSTSTTATVSWGAPENENSDGTHLYQGTEYSVESCAVSAGCDGGSASQSMEEDHMHQSLRADYFNIDEHARPASHPYLSLRGRGLAQDTSNWKVACQTSETRCVVENLNPGTRYVFRVRAKFKKSGFGNYSEEIIVNTEASAPDYDTRVPVLNESVTASSIKVRFIEPKDIGGGPVHAKITQYKLEYRTVGTTPFSEVLHNVVDGQETAVTLTGLGAFTNYEFRVSAQNVAGYGSPGPIVAQKTRGVCGNGNIESGSLGNGLSYAEACDGGHCCSGSCALLDSSHCSGHGSCTDGNTCSCTSGYLGQLCQYSDATTCNGHGTAQSDGSCQCSSGYAGAACQYSDAATCNGHGTAQSDGSCQCSSGYVGPNCQYSDATTCNGHGTAQSDGSCQCSTGYTGSSCGSCSTGYYSSSGTCTICPQGSSCSSGTKTLCGAGTYQDLQGQSSCQSCPSGSTHSTTGSRTVLDCTCSDTSKYLSDAFKQCKTKLTFDNTGVHGQVQNLGATAALAPRGYIYPVTRTCGDGAPTCATVCSGLGLSCLNSLHQYTNTFPYAYHVVGLKTYKYNHCSGGCGPNTCMCYKADSSAATAIGDNSNVAAPSNDEFNTLWSKNSVAAHVATAAACTAGRSGAGWSMLVRRDCASGQATCSQICSGLSDTNAGQLTCDNSYHVFPHQPVSSTTVATAGLRVFKFNSCTTGGCGPNYCCCKEQSNPNPSEVESAAQRDAVLSYGGAFERFGASGHVLAQSVCIALNSGLWSYPVARRCDSGLSCAQICSGLSESQGGNLACMNSIHLYPNKNSYDVNQIGIKVYRYNSCSVNGCAPNFCCCRPA